MLGGARPGAGRKPGVSKATLLKRSFQDYYTEVEKTEFMRQLKKDAKTDPALRRFVAEQLFGKAPQRIEMTGKDGKDLPTPILGGITINNDKHD